MKKLLNTKALIIVAILVLIGLFFTFDLGRFLTLDYLQSQRQGFLDYYNANPVQTLSIYAIIYIIATSLSLPGAVILTLAGGALFGLAVGTVIVSFASTIGATVAFLVARFILRDTLQSKYSDKLKSINEGIEKDGAFYLFTMRLIPAFPFFIVNLVMGLTPLKTMTYFFVSQIGMLPGTIVYVNAGTQLGQLKSLSGILSLNMIGSFALLGIVPLIIKKALAHFRPETKTTKA